MRHDRLLILGGFLVGAMVGAMIVTGCGSSSSSINGAGGKTGSGGSGAGGKAMDAGADKGSTADTGTDTSGPAAAADAHADLATDTGTDTGSGDTATDMAVDTPTDTGATRRRSVRDRLRRGNPVQYAFNGGVNGGLVHVHARRQQHRCSPLRWAPASPRAANVRARCCWPRTSPRTARMNRASSRRSSTLPLNWTAYKALHAWIKAESADPRGSERRLLLYEVGRATGVLSVRLRRGRQPGRLARGRDRSDSSRRTTALASYSTTSSLIGFESISQYGAGRRRARDAQPGAAAGGRHLAGSRSAVRRRHVATLATAAVNEPQGAAAMVSCSQSSVSRPGKNQSRLIANRRTRKLVSGGSEERPQPKIGLHPRLRQRL